jgi:hypothetical protein
MHPKDTSLPELSPLAHRTSNRKVNELVVILVGSKEAKPPPQKTLSPDIGEEHVQWVVAD